MTFRVILLAGAIQQLRSLQFYLAEEVDEAFAADHVENIRKRCSALAHFPLRGSPQEQLGLAYRTIPYKRSATILYRVEEDRVEIIGIYSRGRNWKTDFEL